MDDEEALQELLDGLELPGVPGAGPDDQAAPRWDDAAELEDW